MNVHLTHSGEKPERYYSLGRAEMLPFVPTASKRILEVGCGEASFGKQLKKDLGAEVWGIELNESAALEASKHLDKVVTGDASTLLEHLPPTYFDCVVFNDILEHMTDPFTLLRKTRRILSERGCIVCSLPNIRYAPVLFDLIFRKEWIYKEDGILDMTHYRFFTRNSIVRTLSNLGYSVTRIDGINPLKSWKYRLIILTSFGLLSDCRFLQYACVAVPSLEKE
jgi:2-polyprenyl-3-methyl-5-hydroxy-6-metoxy-1,4-benzoquinol methylase